MAQQLPRRGLPFKRGCLYILGGSPSESTAVGTAFQRRPWSQGHGKHSPHEHRGLLEINMKTALPMDAEKWKLWPVAPPTILLRHHHTSETTLRGLGNLSHPLHPHTFAYKYIMYGSLATVCPCSPKGTAKSFRRPQRNHPALQYVCFLYN